MDNRTEAPPGRIFIPSPHRNSLPGNLSLSLPGCKVKAIRLITVLQRSLTHSPGQGHCACRRGPFHKASWAAWICCGLRPAAGSGGARAGFAPMLRPVRGRGGPWAAGPTVCDAVFPAGTQPSDCLWSHNHLGLCYILADSRARPPRQQPALWRRSGSIGAPPNPRSTEGPPGSTAAAATPPEGASTQVPIGLGAWAQQVGDAHTRPGICARRKGAEAAAGKAASG